MITAKLITALAAILAVTTIELYALHLGIDGVALASTIAVISGLGGYHANAVIQSIKHLRPPK